MFVGCARKQETVLPDLTGYKYFGHQTYEERGEHKFVIYHTPRQSKEYYIETIDQRTMMVFPIVEESETPIVEESTEEKAHSMLNNSDVKFCTDDHCRE